MSTIDILKIRKNLALTQQEFGELIGVDRRTVINYEQGKKVPASKVKLLQLMIDNGLTEVPLEKKEKTLKKIELHNDADILRCEILDLKDHIKTLKDFLEEKNKLAEMYISENNSLKAKLALYAKRETSE
jgi:transcriptional regulator with XRE-family HTH domain